MLRFMCLFFFFLSTATYAATTPKITHVIYITFDGTRWQDIFNDHPYFPKLWKEYAKKGKFYGQPNSNTVMETASIPVSLPSYHTQMAGTVQPCDGNECGRIQVETVAEALVHSLHLKKKEVAIFASWTPINVAAESIPETTFTNTGNESMFDPDTHKADSVMQELNKRQAADTYGDDRFDKYTFAQALHYFEKYQPTFLWISFNDADDLAHEGNLEKYHQTLSFYDDAIDTFFKTIKKLNLEDQTLVIITTDHGRGDGEKWTTHGVQVPESKQTWAFVYNGEFQPISQENGIDHYSTLSIRPTIEKALGLS